MTVLAPPLCPKPTSEPVLDEEGDDDEGWEDMPIIRNVDAGLALDEEDQKKYHYVQPKSKDPVGDDGAMGNATGNLIDFDIHGNEWRSKLEVNESEYTRLQLNEDDAPDEVHLQTKYLFDEDKAMTPLSQMQQTKHLLTEAQRIAYVGLCYLICKQMSTSYSRLTTKELVESAKSLELWGLKIMGRLYYHMEVETQEQKMIESLSQHGVQPEDLIPSLMTTHTVANPEYDPAEARKQEEERLEYEGLQQQTLQEEGEDITSSHNEKKIPEPSESLETPSTVKDATFQTTPNVLQPASTVALPGVSTSLSSIDKEVVLDIRWTVLCDLFLLLVADSVYDARSRVLLEQMAQRLGLGWLDVVKFERRVTDALDIQEDVDKLEQKEIIEGRAKTSRKKRIVMMGLATLGGGLVIGLSAGLLAPVIGAGLGAALTTVGVTGTSTFLAGAGGAAVITTGGVLTGSGIAASGMARRTRQVRTFVLIPLHNLKRVNCIVTVPGFMSSVQDDVRLPFSVLDPIVGDVFSILWEPEMMGETGNALKILTTEVITQLGQTVLQATVMTALMSALQWPIVLTKLGYLIDNPWSNALDRAKAAGNILADVLIQRSLGVRPITLIGFSLGARVIFYALLELSRRKIYGVVQDVFLLGATVTATTKTWHQARSVIAGRFVNGYARNDWILNYLYRASTGGLNTVAGLRPVQNVPGLENADVTDKISGHMSYRVYMPVILDQLGFPVTADHFDEPEEIQLEADRVVERPEDLEQKKKTSRFGLFGRKGSSREKLGKMGSVSRPPSTMWLPPADRKSSVPQEQDIDEEQPPRLSSPRDSSTISGESTPGLSRHVGFDFEAINSVLEEMRNATSHNTASELNPPEAVIEVEVPSSIRRSESTPVPVSSQGGGSLQEDELSSHENDCSHSDANAAQAGRFEDSNLTFDGGDLGDISYNARPPPAPSISFGLENASAWATGREAPAPPPKNLRSSTLTIGSHDDAEEDDIAGTNGGWRPLVEGRQTFYSNINPWRT